MSHLLRQTNKGYIIKDCDVKLNHLLYLDDIKLYGRLQSELESLVHVVQLYSEDICMSFGLAKCRTATVVRGKLCSSEGLMVSDDNAISALPYGEAYRYLGILESDDFHHETMKDALTTRYKYRVKKILSSYLSGKHIIHAINIFAVPLLCYSAGLIKWTLQELQQLDVKTRKLLSIYHAFSVNSDVDRLYVPCPMGGRGLLSVADVVACECNSLYAYMSNSSDCHLQLLLNQLWFQKFDSALSRKECTKRHLEAWQNKSLHGQFY